jgi:Kef-type K+ transport system membrane component KefB
MASWLAGGAMSTTSVAVAYAVILEFGFNATDYGKVVLAACFITDLGKAVSLLSRYSTGVSAVGLLQVREF